VILSILALAIALFLYVMNCNTCVGCHGMVHGQFLPCPRSPNCVSTQMDDDGHYIHPISYKKQESPIPRLAEIVKEIPKARIMDETEDYLHVEFRSPKMNFVDDAEFYWNRQGGLIEMRSAARCGYSDGGVNRDRLDRIRRRFEK